MTATDQPTPRDTFSPGDSITDAGRGYPWTKNVDGTWWRVGQQEPFTWEQVLAWHQAALDNPDDQTTEAFRPVLMVADQPTPPAADGSSGPVVSAVSREATAETVVAEVERRLREQGYGDSDRVRAALLHIDAYRAGRARAGEAEPRTTLLRLAEEVQRSEWPGCSDEARTVAEAIADMLREEAGRASTGEAVDREALREAMLSRWWMDQTGPDADRWETLDAEERENVAENSYADTFLSAVLGFLAARGDDAPSVSLDDVRSWCDGLGIDSDDAGALLTALGIEVRP